MTFALDVSGKTALVTGASSGLGAHFARVLANAGASVVLAARRVPALEALADEIRSMGQPCVVIPLDVTNPLHIAELAPVIQGVDILVNNAGVVHDAPALDQSEADWDLVLDTNLKGMFLVAQAVGRVMKERGKGGSIVNVASILGLRQAGGVVSYAVSKAGVIQLTK